MCIRDRLIGGWGHLLREKGSAYAIVHDFCVKMIEKYEAGIRLNKLEYAFLNNYKMSNIREFTSHYVSINFLWLCSYLFTLYHLHPTMYLLIP